MIISMRKLGRSKQISYPSNPEIISRVDLAAAKLATATTFGGAKLRTGHVVNALALWAAELPDDQLEAAIGPMLRRLEAFLGREDGEGVAAEKPVERTEPPSPALPEVVGLTAVEMPRPRRARAKAGPKRAGRA